MADPNVRPFDGSATALAALGLSGDTSGLATAVDAALRGWNAALDEWLGDASGDQLHRLMSACEVLSAAAERVVLARGVEEVGRG